MSKVQSRTRSCAYRYRDDQLRSRVTQVSSYSVPPPPASILCIRSELLNALTANQSIAATPLRVNGQLHLATHRPVSPLQKPDTRFSLLDLPLTPSQPDCCSFPLAYFVAFVIPQQFVLSSPPACRPDTHSKVLRQILLSRNLTCLNASR